MNALETVVLLGLPCSIISKGPHIVRELLKKLEICYEVQHTLDQDETLALALIMIAILRLIISYYMLESQ